VQRTAEGVLTAPIWIAPDGVTGAFPELEWSDSPVLLLSTWIPSLRRLRDRGQAAECHFMDGPYRFIVSRATETEWRIACFEDREQPSVANAVAEWSTESQAFFDSGLAAARSVLGYCDSRGWWGDDTDRLRAAIALVDPAAAS
jgi:hypothetical protein